MKKQTNYIGILSKDIAKLSTKRPAQIEQYITSLIKNSDIDAIIDMTQDLQSGLIDENYWAYRVAELLGLIPEYQN